MPNIGYDLLDNIGMRLPKSILKRERVGADLSCRHLEFPNYTRGWNSLYFIMSSSVRNWATQNWKELYFPFIHEWRKRRCVDFAKELDSEVQAGKSYDLD